jgi:DNA-binding PadR family transcriptional regulator
MHVTEPGEYAVLGLLVEQPRHGYALSRQFAPSAELRQVVRLEMSQLYATLKKLETLGMISAGEPASAPEHPSAPGDDAADGDVGERAAAHARARRVYHVTGAGRATFEAWLTQPVERPRDLRLMLLLKLFFLLRRSPQDVAALLTRQERVFTDFHAALTRRLAEHLSAASGPSGSGGPPERFSVLVWRARLRQTESALAWIADIRRDLGVGVQVPPASV